MEPWVGLGIGVVLGAATMLLLKKLTSGKTRNGDPEPIIIIGDSSIFFGSLTFKDDWRKTSPRELVYTKPNRKVERVKVDNNQSGNPNKNGKNVLKCVFVEETTGKKVIVTFETNGSGNPHKIKIDDQELGAPSWIETRVGWGLAVNVERQVITLTVDNGQPQGLGDSRELITEVR